MEDGLYVCHDEDFKTEMEYLKEKVDAGRFIGLNLSLDPEPQHTCFYIAFSRGLRAELSCMLVGADLIITQMIFDPAVYASFLKACRDYGITIPIIPGIMCIQNHGGFSRMTRFCKSRVPAELVKAIEDVKDDKDMLKKVSIQEGTKLCKALQEAGAPGLHFYTLNLEKVTLGILSELGLNKVPVE
eukprot:TRINITY_DN8723_c0_g1_i3.p2 TRINITY_DN8723_c0_g1~~TRINITY_DN8723_c0_g1_i3.p2  ORF type:complete len:186 (+),score=48.82 TRINITY_DN8723_c0_g1_i3:832-1389(+)